MHDTQTGGLLGTEFTVCMWCLILEMQQHEHIFSVLLKNITRATSLMQSPSNAEAFLAIISSENSEKYHKLTVDVEVFDMIINRVTKFI